MSFDLVSKLKERLSEPLPTSVDIVNDSSGLTVTDKVNLLPDIYNAATTFRTDDPGDHKKKALLGLAATAGAAYATSKYFNEGLRRGIKDQLSPRTPGGPGIPAIISTLLSAATPAAIYYTVQNRDRDDRFAIGAAATGATLVGHDLQRHRIKSTGIPPEMRGPLLKADASLLAMTGAGIYTMHQLQAAADQAKLKALETDGTLSDVEKAKAINTIQSRKDFLTRYPVFRYAPYASKLREVYNRYHQPEPRITPEDADRFFNNKIQ